MELPRFEFVARRRPVAVVQPGSEVPEAGFAAAEAPVDGPATVGLRSDDAGVTAVWDGERVHLDIEQGGVTARHTSRRHGRGQAPGRLAVATTGAVATAFVQEAGNWVARAVVDLVETHGLGALDGPVATGDVTEAGAFGQLGLRDLRLVTHADGTPYVEGDRHLLTATSAGPAGFRTGHTSVWSLDAESLDLTHRSDLYFRRQHRVHGDHATHLVRDDDRWLVAASTWGDFDRRRNPRVGVTIASSTADLLGGTHVIDSQPLELPTDPTSVGTWDPHLVRTDEGWLVAFVSASRFFRFHPVVAEGPDLATLRSRGAASDRTACEGPTLVRFGDAWLLAASDGRDGRRGQQSAYPVFDLDLQQLGELDATYPTNISWPTLLRQGDGWLMIGFDGEPHGGRLLGYGTHGDVVFQRSRASDRPT